MAIISGKAAIKPLISSALTVYTRSGMGPFISTVHDAILKAKVRYPVLEYVAEELYKHIPVREHITVTDRIIALKENGSEVIAGKVLQLRLQAHYTESVDKAIEYIIAGSNWLSCDTVGERVLGHALLTMPERAIKTLKKLAKHDNNWVIRSIGVATHYAVKKGLQKEYADDMFRLLLSFAATTDFHTKKGIGWGAKTIAKFHPDIVARYSSEVENNPQVKQWFKTKIKIGLGRSYKYAHRYTG